jgi:hypothetical protein
MTEPRHRPARGRAGSRALGASGALAAATLLLVLGKPVAGADPLPPLPTFLPPLPTILPPLPTLPPLPLPTVVLPPPPTIPLPTVPLPTIVPPTLPVPSLPVPTLPVPSLPVPSLPLPTLPLTTGGPAPSGAAGSLGPSGSADLSGSPTALAPGLASPGPSASEGAPGSVTDPTVDQGSAPFGFVLPLLIAGIPIAVILLIVGLQVAGGAAWLPVIRRWLNRTPAAGP